MENTIDNFFVILEKQIEDLNSGALSVTVNLKKGLPVLSESYFLKMFKYRYPIKNEKTNNQ